MPIPTIGQESNRIELFSVPGPATLTFPGPILAGSTIAVFISAWNNAEVNGIVASVVDSASNNYTRMLSVEDDSTAHSFMEFFAFLNSPAQAAGATLTITFNITSPAVNRITAVAYEIRGADRIALGPQGSARVGANSTSISLSAPPTGGTDRLAMYAMGSLSTGGATGYTPPAGWTVQEQVTDTSGGQMALLVASRGYATDPGAQTVTTSMANVLFGATAIFVAFIPEVAQNLRVVVECGDNIIAGFDPVFEVFTPPPSSLSLTGAKLFAASGVDVSIGAAPNAFGRIEVQIVVPAGPSLSVGDNVVVIGRARNPADSNEWYGSHVINATVVDIGI